MSLAFSICGSQNWSQTDFNQMPIEYKVLEIFGFALFFKNLYIGKYCFILFNFSNIFFLKDQEFLNAMSNLYRAHWIIELRYVDKLINSARGHDEWGCC